MPSVLEEVVEKNMESRTHVAAPVLVVVAAASFARAGAWTYRGHLFFLRCSSASIASLAFLRASRFWLLSCSRWAGVHFLVAMVKDININKSGACCCGG